MNRPTSSSLVANLAIVGNAVFILWITFNAIDESFSASLVQLMSYIGLMVLLVTNIILLARYSHRRT